MPSSPPNPNRIIVGLAIVATLMETTVGALWTMGIALDAKISQSTRITHIGTFIALYGIAVIATWFIAFISTEGP